MTSPPKSHGSHKKRLGDPTIETAKPITETISNTHDAMCLFSTQQVCTKSGAARGDRCRSSPARVRDFLATWLSGCDDLLMDQGDPEKRIADLERQLAEQRHGADLPPQTPGYLRRSEKKLWQRVAICTALFVVGNLLIVFGPEARTVVPGVVWIGLVVLGVVLVVLSVLLPVRWLTNFRVEVKKEAALRKPGTVELLTVASSFVRGGEGPDHWELKSQLQICLDSGDTFRGSYRTTVEDHRLREWGQPLDAWFHVGSSLLCRYNPTNPDKVLVFPFAVKGDEVSYNEITNTGPDHVWFYSAT
jgi:hypothetical protein